MNTPSPLIPQGAIPTTRSRSHIRIAVFTILAVHLVLLFALLMAGCKKTAEQAKNDVTADTGAPVPPPFDPSVPPAGSNPPASVAPTGTAPLVTSSTSTPPLPPPIEQPKVDSAPAPSSNLAEGTEHTIIKGESFYTLSKKYNVSTRAIVNANPGVDPARLKIGQKVKIPAAAAPAASTPAGGNATAIATANEKLYTVKSGDTLNRIAKNNGVTVKALRAENSLKTDQIKVGQKLKIPGKGSDTAPAAAAGGTGTNS